ncbi:RNA-directed DNA polymerase, eukaryota [Tanacetum coccineum]
MDNDSNIECVSISDGMEDEEEMESSSSSQITHQQQFPSKSNIGINVNGLPPATSVHELLECPVCTNSMYPPIHQDSYDDWIAIIGLIMQLNSLAEISRMTTLVPCEDRYVWTLDSDGVFSLASIRKEIDGNQFQDVSLPTRWVKSVPIKIMRKISSWWNIDYSDVNSYEE